MCVHIYVCTCIRVCIYVHTFLHMYTYTTVTQIQNPVKCPNNEHVRCTQSAQRRHTVLFIKNSAFIYVILWKNNYIPFLKNIEDNEIKK